MRFRLAAALMGVAGLAACHSPAPPTPVQGAISLAPSGPVAIAAAGQSGVTATVTISNVTTWTAVSDSTFVTVTGGGSGTANGTITYSVAANTTTTTRTAHINVTGNNNASASLEIDQAAAAPPPPSSSLAFSTPSPVALTAESQSASASISSNVNWSVSSDQSFLTFSGPTAGSNNGSVNYNVTANGGNARSAHITATATGVPSVQLSVNQAGLAAAFTFSATASVTGGDCAVKPSPSGSPQPAQILCKFDPSTSAPASLITSYKFVLVEESNEVLGTGSSVGTALTNPLTACGFGSNTATPITIQLTVTTATGTATVNKTVVLVKSGVC